MSWEDAVLRDLVLLQRGFDITKEQQRPGGIPVISSSGFQICHDEAKVAGPGVIVGRKGSVGTVYYSEGDYWPHDTTLWSKELRGNSAKFVYYFLKTLKLQHFDVGNSNPTLNRNHIHNLPIKKPDRQTQDRIVDILSTYDDLIENNRRRIQLLEQAARLLYKEWFVRLRFPGHERVKITSGVPEGWEKKTLGDVLVDIESGGRPKGGSRENGIPSIGAENVIGLGQYDYTKEKYIPDEYFNAMRKGVVQNRDVVVYKDGANIGRSSYFGEGFPHEQCAVNEHVFILRGLPELGQNLLYFWVAQEETRQRIANLNANTAQPGVSQNKLKTLSFVQPQHVVTRLFDENVEPIVRQIFVLARENRKLIQARDLLLPRLMNGQVVI